MSVWNVLVNEVGKTLVQKSSPLPKLILGVKQVSHLTSKVYEKCQITASQLLSVRNQACETFVSCLQMLGCILEHRR